MTEYNSLNVKLSNSQLNKLKNKKIGQVVLMMKLIFHINYF